MPQKDKTGPLGKGPRTGRGLGFCKKKELGEPIKFIGKGLGRGKGRRKVALEVCLS